MMKVCVLFLLAALPALPQFGDARSLQHQPIKPGMTCASDAYVLTWVAAHNQFECLAASGAPTGAAGGVLGGTYPSPTFAGGASFNADSTTFLNGAGSFTSPGTANARITFSNVASATMTLTGVAVKAVVTCWDSSVSPARLFIPDSVEQTDADTLTFNFSPNATGYCDGSTGIGLTGATGPAGPAGGVSSLTGTANQIVVSAATGAITVSLGTGIDATKIGAGAVSSTEFGYLDGVTSAIQTQLDLKAPLASPTFTGTVAVGTTFIDSGTAVATPASPALAVVGTTTNDTNWGYTIVAGSLGGSPVILGSAPSIEATITGNDTLDGMHSITITPPACSGPITSFDIYRSSADGTPGTLGLIGNVLCGNSLSDIGLPIVGNLVQVPAVSYSIGIGSTIPWVNSKSIAVGSQAVLDPAATFPDSFFPPGNFPNAGTAFNVLEHTGNPSFLDAAMMLNLNVDTDPGFGSAIGAAFNLAITADIANNFSIITPVFSTAVRGSATGTSNADVAGGGFGVNNNTPVATGHKSMGVYVASENTSSMTGTANTDGLFGVYSYMHGGNTVADRMVNYYAKNNSAGAGGAYGFVAAWFNENMTGIAGVGKDFSWYSQGGTNHLETGEAATVGLEIEAHAGQTANLFQNLGSDGTTVLSYFTANGSVGFNGHTCSIVATVLTCP